jgi:hypothetical protein
VSEAPEQPTEEQPIPVYVYAVVMMPSGEVKVISRLPFDAQREAVASDIVMTSGYVHDLMKAGSINAE